MILVQEKHPSLNGTNCFYKHEKKVAGFTTGRMRVVSGLGLAGFPGHCVSLCCTAGWRQHDLLSAVHGAKYGSSRRDRCTLRCDFALHNCCAIPFQLYFAVKCSTHFFRQLRQHVRRQAHLCPGQTMSLSGSFFSFSKTQIGKPSKMDIKICSCWRKL